MKETQGPPLIRTMRNDAGDIHRIIRPPFPQMPFHHRTLAEVMRTR